MGITAKGKKNAGLLTEGSIAKGILSFAIPLFLAFGILTMPLWIGKVITFWKELK